MRNIILMLMRHAQAENGPTASDFDRPLSTRGEDEARRTALALAHGALPEIVLCSPALRTVQTANIFLQTTVCRPELLFIPSLYLAHTEQIWREASPYLTAFNHILVIGHNPGISDLAQELNEKYSEESMKTSELAIFEATGQAGQCPGKSAFTLRGRIAKGHHREC